MPLQIDLSERSLIDPRPAPGRRQRRSNRVAIPGEKFVIYPLTFDAMPVWSDHYARAVALTVYVFAIEFYIGLAIFGPAQNTLSRCEAIFAWSRPRHGFIRLGLGIPNLARLVRRRDPPRWCGIVRLSHGFKRNK